MSARPYGPRPVWRDVRRYLNGHRHDLARAADRLYPDLPRVGSTHLLTRAEWTLDRPLPLDRLVLRWTDRSPAPAVTGREAEAGSALPPGTPSYAQAMEALDRPGMFENRTCYRLLDVAWPELGFTRGRYFDGVDVGEAVAHEFAASRLPGTAGPPGEAGPSEEAELSELSGEAGLPGTAGLPFRRLAGDPTDLRSRTALPAVSMLTLRHDGRTGAMTFVLHWRDPARVAHGGGLYQVMPVGVFQPAEETPHAEAADFDLWKCTVREYAEEFLRRPEVYGDAFDYETWPLYRELADARESGRLHSSVLGIGVDPLTFATDILAVTVIEADVFDAVFGDITASNEEGRVVGARGIPFDADTVSRYVHHEPMQAAGAAVLQLAWKHRHDLISSPFCGREQVT
ncbi:hypothetical protein GCM10010156_21160 [Planobispora rosea]|uniref:Uncharacterized protein n=1 Tax=Planobispora rosea TaxID=35762 RepID=A0A8J3RWG9_PLARO|nr:hypothetical protein [Planobispora rosea]GGS62134.1 hypothetical protein GCM10010156_21160 [Planobispora rosea]GIH84371.1 hypothetical protein Pro02_27790 [Planobispora rosea]